ncbi:hypothetical protein AB1Y20_018412 [Prymnesium parvum]|uniref:BPL/LPL catalytic domain-containing protein n=1 Tax=Prymnesium parvum TaxID=97485 RepID=A0AB34JP63_PRYPA
MTSNGALCAAPFDERRYAAALGRCGIGAALRVYDRVDSTMVVADELLRAEGSSRAHGKLVLAETQTAGQGRRGRSWQSEAGNLYFSLVWAPQPAASPAEMLPELVRLNLATGVAVVHAVAAAGFPGARIKWPNDVYHGTPPRKLSGMLVNFNGQDAAVLGVGINVLQDMPEAGTAVSLAMLQSESTNAKVPVREDVLAFFCKELERLMALSNAAVLAEYEENDFLRGKTIRVHHKTREEHDARDFLAEVLGVDSSGMLRVRSLESSGKEVLLSGEEVSITPQRS